MQGLQACAAIAVYGPEDPTLSFGNYISTLTNSTTYQPLRFPKLRIGCPFANLEMFQEKEDS
ncbi:hypothetical protein APTSU1_001627700 [Apodemus speciosus]|uniref:Uncharacterized protein n=1 Tax=Apodemus speciosus TaxID=105296 RepID=A0ABQ0FP82_APOSI